MKYAALALDLLQPKARKRIGALAVAWIVVLIFGAIAFAFAIAGVFLLLSEMFGAPYGAFLTAGALLFVALCILIGIAIAHQRKPPPPLLDPATIALLGLLAGLAGVDALKSKRDTDKD